MKRLLIAVLAMTALLAAPAVAYATADGRARTVRAASPAFTSMDVLTTTKVSPRGAYRWLPPGRSTRGAFNIKGTLRSMDSKNGAKLEVRVEGYSKRTFRAARGTSKSYNELVYDGAAQRTTEAWVKVCRDRGSLIPDNCSDELRFERR